MLNRMTRISLLALALLAAFTLGMIFAQRTSVMPAHAAETDPVVSAFPLSTEQTTQGNITTTKVSKIILIRASGGRRTYAEYQF
jgi:hypothetical protein